MASKRSIGFAVVMSLVLCSGVIWLVVSVRMEENDKTAQAETYEYNGWTYYVYDDPIPLRIEDLINPICLCLHVSNILSGIGYLFRLA